MHTSRLGLVRIAPETLVKTGACPAILRSSWLANDCFSSEVCPHQGTSSCIQHTGFALDTGKQRFATQTRTHSHVFSLEPQRVRLAMFGQA